MPSKRRKELDKQKASKIAAMSSPGYKSKYARKRASEYRPDDHVVKERHGESFRLNPISFMRTNKDAFGGWEK